MPTQTPLTAYIKPSDYCNVGCDHCYLPVEVRASKVIMKDDILTSALQAISDMKDRQKNIGVLIVWHGGEPLSLPQDYFTHIAQTTKNTLPDAIQSIQTSLIPYGKKWKNLIADYMGAEIGTSVDFTQRTLKGSNKAYLDFWMNKVSLARADGFTIIPGMVPSMGEMSRGRDIASWLFENGFTSWNIDRYNQFGRTDIMRPNNKEHSLFLSEVFESIMDLSQRGNHIKVNTVRAALIGVMYGIPGERWGGSCSRDFIVVNPDGGMNACPDKISFEAFSNVKDGFAGFSESEVRKKWIREHIMGHRNPNCPTCPFAQFCKGGCPLTPNLPDEEGECSGYRKYLHNVESFIKKNPSLVHEYLEATS